MSDKDTILVYTTGPTSVRSGFTREINVNALSKQVNLFLAQVENIIDESPSEVGKFRFTEFTVSAEISAEGNLMLVGAGAKAGAKGGLVFKFERKS